MDITLIGYCGLDCAECFSYKMTISEAAKSLRREMRANKVKDVWPKIPFLGDYALFKKTLDGLAMLHCKKACRAGSGNSWCKIRKCAQKKELTGCWDCTDFADCGKLDERHQKEIGKIKKAAQG